MHLAEVSQREELGMGEEFQLKLQCRCFAAADLDASSGRVIAGADRGGAHRLARNQQVSNVL